MHSDIPAKSDCMSCESLACVVCEAEGVRIREGWAFSVAPSADSDPSNIYRCPLKSACVNEPDRLCREGTTGLLCAVCETGYGKAGDECRLCSETARTHSLTFGIVVLATVLCLATYYCSKRRSASGDDEDMTGRLTTDNPLTSSLAIESETPRGRSSHDLGLWFRALYQPVRILVGYGQVVTQIGPVLHFDFPPGIRRVFGFLHPVAVDLQSLLQLDCVLHTSFYNMWILRVLVIPAALVACVGVRYLYETKYSADPSSAEGNFRANIFVVIFLVYPGVCNQAFSMFNCRELDRGARVLLLDYSIECNTATHMSFQAVAVVVVAVFAFGTPVYLIALMIRRMQEYQTGIDSADRFVARRVADELHIDDVAATDAIRDVSTGREYSFLVNAFKPRHYYWEGKIHTAPVNPMVIPLPCWLLIC